MVRHPPAFNPEKHPATRRDEARAKAAVFKIQTQYPTVNSVKIHKSVHLEPLLMRILSLMVNVQ